MTKAQIRKEMLNKRAALTREQIMNCAGQIAQRILRMDAWKDADTILSYRAVRSEADPSGLLQAAWEEGKRIYLPRTIGKKMIFIRFEPGTSLVPGQYGIPEPDGNELWDGEGAVMAIVPGTAFSPDGYRIGYGGGYYDRFLADCFRNSERDRFSLMPVGFAYEFQITEEIVPEVHDVRMDAVVTEQRIRIIRNLSAGA